MAMIGELFAGFDNLKSFVEKMSETFDKTSDVTSRMVRVFDGICKQNFSSQWRRVSFVVRNDKFQLLFERVHGDGSSCFVGSGATLDSASAAR